MIRFFFQDTSGNALRNPLAELRALIVEPLGGDIKTLICDANLREKIQNYELDLRIRPGLMRGASLRINELLCTAVADINRHKRAEVSKYAEIEADIPDLPEWMRSQLRSEVPTEVNGVSLQYIPTEIPLEVLEATILVEHLHINMSAYLELVQKYLALITKHLPSLHANFKDKKNFFAYLIGLGVEEQTLTVVKVTRDCIHEHAPEIEVREQVDGRIQFVACYEKVFGQRSQLKGQVNGAAGLAIDIESSARLSRYIAIEIPRLITLDCRERLGDTGAKVAEP